MSKKQLVKNASVRKASSPALVGSESNLATDPELPHATSFVTQSEGGPVEPVVEGGAVHDATRERDAPRVEERSLSTVGRNSNADAKKRQATSPAADSAKMLVSLQESLATSRLEFERTSKSLSDMTALYERASERLEHLDKECAAVTQLARELKDAKLAAEREVVRISASQHTHTVEIKTLRGALRQTEKLLEQSNMEIKHLREAAQYQPPCDYCTRTREEGDKFRKQNKELRNIIEQMEEEERQHLPLAERIRPLNKTNQAMKQQNLELLSKLAALTDKEKTWQKEKAEMAATVKHLQVQLSRASSHEHRVMELEVQNQLLLTMLQKKGGAKGGVGGDLGPLGSLQRDRHSRAALSPAPSASSGKPPRVLPPLIQSSVLDQPPPARVPRVRAAPPVATAEVAASAIQATPSRISRISSISSSTSQQNDAAVVDPPTEDVASRSSPSHSRAETPVSAPGPKESSAVLGESGSCGDAGFIEKEKSLPVRSISPSQSPRSSRQSSSRSAVSSSPDARDESTSVAREEGAVTAVALEREASGCAASESRKNSSTHSAQGKPIRQATPLREVEDEPHNPESHDDDIDLSGVLAASGDAEEAPLVAQSSEHQCAVSSTSQTDAQERRESCGSSEARLHEQNHDIIAGTIDHPHDITEGDQPLVKHSSNVEEHEEEPQTQQQPQVASQGSYENDASFEATSTTDIASIGGKAEKDGVTPANAEERHGEQSFVDDDAEATVMVNDAGQNNDIPVAQNEPSWLDD